MTIDRQYGAPHRFFKGGLYGPLRLQCRRGRNRDSRIPHQPPWFYRRMEIFWKNADFCNFYCGILPVYPHLPHLPPSSEAFCQMISHIYSPTTGNRVHRLDRHFCRQPDRPDARKCLQNDNWPDLYAQPQNNSLYRQSFYHTGMSILGQRSYYRKIV